MRVTPHFWSEEWDCKDGTPYPIEWYNTRLRPLCEALEVVRSRCGNFPLVVVSGYRTIGWNTEVGGAKDSRHLHGDAADFIIPGVLADVIYQHAFALQETGVIKCGGLALYKAARVPFVHLDVRGQRARWEGNPDQVPL